jgi:hypothetical protein
MNKIELLQSWGFKRVPSNGLEFYRLVVNDRLLVEVYTSFQVFGIDQVDIITINEDSDTCYTELPKVNSVYKVKQLIDLL